MLGLGLLFKRQTWFFLGLVAAFAYPMFQSGELSVSKIAGWLTGNRPLNPGEFDPYMAGANGPLPNPGGNFGTPNLNGDPNFGGFGGGSSFGGGGFGGGGNGNVWATASQNFSQQNRNLPNQTAGSGGGIGDQLGQLLGSMFETQTIDANGNRIDIPATGPPNFSGAPAPAGNSPLGPASASVPLWNVSTSANNGNAPWGESTNNGWNGGLSNAADPRLGIPTTPIDFVPVFDLREIIRFDISPPWVQQRWSRSSAAPQSEQGYQGLRVPLVAGTGTADLTGALTYYFDEKNEVQRIQFQGSSNNPNAIEKLLTTYFQFQAVDDVRGLYAPVFDQQARGMLRFSMPAFYDRNQAAQQTQVAFEINSTKGDYQLSPLFRSMALQ